MDDRLAQDDPRLGHPDLGDRVHCRDGSLQGSGVRHPDVLTRRDDDAPRDKPRVLPASIIRAK